MRRKRSRWRVLCAVAGASQYLWNVASLWHLPDVDWTLPSLARAFWFDVTKSDWRDTMIFTVHPVAAAATAGDVPVRAPATVGNRRHRVACLGAAALLRRWRTALLVFSAYRSCPRFRRTYNVGDAHVFFLPSHYCVDAGVRRRRRGNALALREDRDPGCTPAVTAMAVAIALTLPAWRAWDTLPAVDRHDDRRPVQWLNAVTRGLDDRIALRRRRQLAAGKRLRLLLAPPSAGAECRSRGRDAPDAALSGPRQSRRRAGGRGDAGRARSNPPGATATCLRSALTNARRQRP